MKILGVEFGNTAEIRLFDILFYHHLIFGNSTDSYSVLEELTNRIQTGLNQKTFSCDRIWPKARSQKGIQTITDDKRKGSTSQSSLYLFYLPKWLIIDRHNMIYERILYRTCEDKESDMHAFIKQLQSTKLNDLSNRISNSEIGNNVANTRLSKAADAREEAKLNQMKKTRSNPDITPCYKCGKRAVYSAECGCRLHSGTVGFRLKPTHSFYLFQKW